ncbi:unnamed protein product [Sphenostylis stenocarpa]|uniref:Uncharacterized protein n=1 Tax=Sphenostylis stenocarpa TaxID=92480 RepID=A0AA86RZ86_9FABA|nr:unnamed protein product [Sphenostylis stenocarpa]
MSDMILCLLYRMRVWTAKDRGGSSAPPKETGESASQKSAKLASVENVPEKQMEPEELLWLGIPSDIHHVLLLGLLENKHKVATEETMVEKETTAGEATTE